jgi:hypothetical protein
VLAAFTFEEADTCAFTKSARFMKNKTENNLFIIGEFI